MKFEGIVSKLSEIFAHGAQATLQLLRGGELAVADTMPRFAEATLRGESFVLDSGPITMLAAHATKGAMGTIRFINGFYNPPGSGVNAIIVNVKVATRSGTPGGPYLYNFFQSKLINTAETGKILNAILNAITRAKTGMIALVDVVLTTLPADTTSLATQFAAVGGPAAIASGAGIASISDEVDGFIVVPPGTAFGICATAVGTTHIVESTIRWVEKPSTQID